MYYFATDGSYRAKPCKNNNYGVALPTYGLMVNPCRDCPVGMQTDTLSSPSMDYLDSNLDLSDHGFTNPKACVTSSGYGMTDRGAVLCSSLGANYYGTALSYEPCKALPCGEGKQADQNGVCVIKPGWGTFGGTFRPCPPGE